MYLLWLNLIYSNPTTNPSFFFFWTIIFWTTISWLYFYQLSYWTSYYRLYRLIASITITTVVITTIVITTVVIINNTYKTFSWMFTLFIFSSSSIMLRRSSIYYSAISLVLILNNSWSLILNFLKCFLYPPCWYVFKENCIKRFYRQLVIIQTSFA